MKKRFRDTDGFKLLRTLGEIAGIALLIWLIARCVGLLINEVHAEAETRWVICQPDDVLLVRERPKKTARTTGELIPGRAVTTDGKRKNGYAHIVELSNESGDGWVSERYLVDEEPEVVGKTATVTGRGRVAARKWIGGKRARWLQPGSTVTVLLRTSEWCVTDKGYVMTKYLTVDGEEE